ncbi:hypothetical protein R5R35_004269 [Gryllus longicercus]|uniref:Uncharacterized protein n=1 Tax=Gryllus longicercus TaxID=2509291 RepID=A0AAN9VZQ6_9ORTH
MSYRVPSWERCRLLVWSFPPPPLPPRSASPLRLAPPRPAPPRPAPPRPSLLNPLRDRLSRGLSSPSRAAAYEKVSSLCWLSSGREAHPRSTERRPRPRLGTRTMYSQFYECESKRLRFECFFALVALQRFCGLWLRVRSLPQ